MNIRIVFLIFVLSIAYTAEAQRQHPYLFFTDDKISQLQQALKSDKDKQQLVGNVKKIADDLLEERHPYTKIEYLALMYQLSGEVKYAEKIKSCIRMLGEKKTLEPIDMLNRTPAWTSLLATAHANFQMSIGFDAVYSSLTVSERKELAEIIYNIGILPTWRDWLSPETRFHAINSMGHNYWISCIGMMGIASLAIIEEKPEVHRYLDYAVRAASDWVRFSGDNIQNKPANFDNGAYYESVAYANYAIAQYLYFQLALKNYDDAYVWEDREYFSHAANYFLHTSYPAHGSFLPSLYFGDGSISANGEAVVKLLWAMGIQHRDMLWYLKQVRPNQQKESMPLDHPMGLLYSPDLSEAPEVPSSPQTICYENMGWATLRSSWKPNSTLLGIKSGHTWNHAHADAGSFILFHNGQQLIKDAGNCWYPNPWYREYFFQSDAHNVLLFDGKAQPTHQQYHGSLLDGKLRHLVDSGNIKYIFADVTGPTASYFTKNHRSFLWIDDVILVIDDASTNDHGIFSFLIHPDGQSQKKGIDLNISKGNAAVSIRPIWPEYLTESDFEHDFPENLKIRKHEAPVAKDLNTLEAYYSITNPKKNQRNKFITAIILKDSVESMSSPQVTRIASARDLLGVKIAHRGKITEVYLNELADGRVMHRNSSTSIAGWDTDAYLFAFSYQEGSDPEDTAHISEFFVGYGSYVRKNGATIFDAFTKQFTVIRKT